jgi:hypothetical protein
MSHVFLFRCLSFETKLFFLEISTSSSFSHLIVCLTAQIVSLNEEVRRALYGTDRLSTLDLDSYLPDLIGPTEVLTDDVRKQLVKHLPARVEGTIIYQ